MLVSSSANTWLSQFKIEITSNANKVYGNGRQQLEATVTVAPRSNGSISSEQMDSISLVILDDDGVYRELEGALQASLERDNRFDYFAATGGAPSNLELQGSTRRKRFYISSTRSGGSLDRVYARISKDDRTHYVTNAGAFNSSIIVETIRPLRSSKDEFELVVEDSQIRDWYVATPHYLRFKNPNYQIVDYLPYTPSDNHSEYATAYDDASHALTLYRERPPTPQNPVNKHFCLHYVITKNPRFTRNTASRRFAPAYRPGQMTLLLVQLIGVANFTPLTRPALWTLIDQYGNEHKIEMTQRDNGKLMDFKRYDWVPPELTVQ